MLIVASLGICVSSSTTTYTLEGITIHYKPDRVYHNRHPIHNIKYLCTENAVFCYTDKKETELDIPRTQKRGLRQGMSCC